MKKILVVLFVFLLSLSVFAEERMTVGVWVNVEDDIFRTRIENEIVFQLERSQEWPFNPELYYWPADIHVIISGMRIHNSNSYAWSITYAPIHIPRYSNGVVAVTEANINGMNWLARSAVKYVEEQLYFLMDELSRDGI